MVRSITPSAKPDVKKHQRLRSLDGLRGVAALIVLLHHSLLLIPGFSATYEGGTLPVAGSALWWLSYSPLKLLTAGGEAVIVFFVLSGLVVTLPVLTRPTFSWIAYYPQRVLRLVLPVFASILVAAALILSVRQDPFQLPGTWLARYSTPHPTVFQFLEAANLFDGRGNFHVNNPLWSLRWELFFSLALPIFALLAISLKRWWLMVGFAAIALTLLGNWTVSLLPLAFLPSFLLGALLASKLRDIQKLAGRINASRWRHLIWASFTALGLLLLVGSWLTGPLPKTSDKVTLILVSLVPLAACIIVVACIGWGLLDRLLSTRLFQFFGRISFSLYLIHVPVLIFTSYLLRGQHMLLVIIAGDLFALVTAYFFYWLIESRSHVLSRRVGDWGAAKMLKYHQLRSRESTNLEL